MGLTVMTLDEILKEWDEQHINDAPEPTCTNKELVDFLQDLYGDNIEDTSWKPKEVLRGSNKALVEWRSNRGHFSVSLVFWDDLFE